MTDVDPIRRTSLDHLFRTEAPWITVGPGEPERLALVPSDFYARDGLSVCVRSLRGSKMRSTPALMTEFGAALQFFHGFGENWNALGECLAYLDEWLPADGYVLVVERAEELLQEDVGELVWLMKVLNETGAWWSRPITDDGRFDRPDRPFHVLLHPSAGVVPAETEIVRAARAAGIPLGM